MQASPPASEARIDGARARRRAACRTRARKDLKCVAARDASDAQASEWDAARARRAREAGCKAACGRRAASARPQGRGGCVVLGLTCVAAAAGGPEAELRASACSATRRVPEGLVPRVGHPPAGACIRCTHTAVPRQIVGAARRHTSRIIRRAASISDISSRAPPRAEVPTLRTPTPTPHERRTRLRASSRRRRPTSSFTRVLADRGFELLPRREVLRA